jgi:ribosomal protein L7/L12
MADMDKLIEQIDELSLAEIEELIEYLKVQRDLKEDKPKKPFILGLHPGAITITDDFNDPLPDSFWLGEE